MINPFTRSKKIYDIERILKKYERVQRTVVIITVVLVLSIAMFYLKMLGLYLLGHNCLHLTFEQYLSSETYSSKFEKLPNIVILVC